MTDTLLRNNCVKSCQYNISVLSRQTVADLSIVGDIRTVPVYLVFAVKSAIRRLE